MDPEETQEAPAAELTAASYYPDSYDALRPVPRISPGFMSGKVQLSLKVLCLSPALTMNPRPPRSIREPMGAFELKQIQRYHQMRQQVKPPRQRDKGTF